MRPAVECDGRVAAADGSALPAAPRVLGEADEGPILCVHLSVFLAGILCKYALEFGLRVAGVRRPEIGFARKAGDCFGFSPSFTEWIFVLSDCGRF